MRGRDPAAQLVRALIASAAEGVTIEHEGETPWASATFVGAQHRLRVHGASDGWLDGLEEADLPMRGCFVASVEVARNATGTTLTMLVLEA